MNWSTITITVGGTTWTGLEVCALLAGLGLVVIVVVVAVSAVLVTLSRRHE